MSTILSTSTPALFNLDGIQFVTANVRRPGMSFTLVVRPKLGVMLINNDTFEVVRGTEIEMKQEVYRDQPVASLLIKLVPDSENYPMTHEWITLVDHIAVMEN
jgi:hypothetical protein